jgi:hypothetical protein
LPSLVSVRIHVLLKVYPALLLACAAACAPIVTHTPRVEQGFSLFGTAGGGTRLCDSVGCDTQLVPQQGLGVRYGQAATETRPGVSAAITFSTAIVSSELDLYVQAPTAVGLDVGAGVLTSLTHDMPYVQVGRIREDGSGWYTTQGYAFLASRPPEWSLSFDGPPTADEVEPRYWAPTVAYRSRGRPGFHVYLSGAFGSAKAVVASLDSLPARTTTRQPVRVLMMGIVFDVQPVPPRPLAPPPSIPAVPPTGLPH